MGAYDTVEVPCPKCSEIFYAQSKSGFCRMDNFSLDNAPLAVLFDVNRHAPFVCEKCGTRFKVLEPKFLPPQVSRINKFGGPSE